ncbi:hypothetical protein KKC45_02745 [Patescibacteria group bacterium]|nr:hypothetical protein [Patescibacteria group bacterium]
MENINNKNKCAVVISSCDAYADVWDSFFIQFFKYWPDCPFPVYLVANELDYSFDKVNVIKTGKDDGFANNMKKATELINAEYFICLIDDFHFDKKIDTKRILRLLEIMEKENAGYLRLNPMPGPDSNFKDYSEVGLISRDSEYRTSLMAALWNNKIFNQLLVTGENPWEMELKGTERSRNLEELFLSVKRSPFLNRNNNPAISYFHNSIKRGYWHYDAIKFLKKEGVIMDKSKREIESFGAYIKRKIFYIPFFGRAIQGVLKRLR